MRCRPVDDYGDMMPVSRSMQMWDGTVAISQAITSRIRMIIGEWWENEELGFEVPRFLMEGLRENQVGMLVGYVVAYILQTPEVTSLASQSYSLENRELTIDVAVNTSEGETTEGSVSMNELLSAVSG